MEAGFTDNFSQFNHNMGRYCDELGLAGPEVVLNQSGLLSRTLIEISPPLRKEQTAKKIDASIDSKIVSVAAPPREFFGTMGGKNGSGDVDWYAWYPTALYGVKREADMLEATPEELFAVLKKVAPDGRIDAGMRGKQHVWIWQKIVARKATVLKIKKMLKDRIGRLKAAWVVCWQDSGSPNGSVGPVPEWVMKHAPGSRNLQTGFTVNGLGIPGFPTFTITNQCAGVSQLIKQHLMDDALGIRAKAMAADLALYANGTKHVRR
jgi:hypothetical protein